MRATIDKAGRLVIPKPIRDQLGLSEGGEVEVSVRDSRIEIEVPPVDVRLEKRDGVYVAVPAHPLPQLTVEMVRDALEQVRR